MSVFVLTQTALAIVGPLLYGTALATNLFPHRDVLSASDSAPECSALSSLWASCAADTPGFSTLTESQVQCLCYKSSTLVPTIYDNAFATCMSYYQTADPALLTSAGIAQFSTLTAFNRTWTTPCAEYSAYLSVQSVKTDPRISACVSWSAIFSSCVAATPGFLTLPLNSKASCACYLSTGVTYAPQVYDGYLNTCLDYYSTHYSQYYSQTLDGDQILRSPCSVIGNVRNGVTATGAQASPSIPTVTSTATTASEALTTTQPRPTATSNQAHARDDVYDWMTLLTLSGLPFFLMLYL